VTPFPSPETTLHALPITALPINLGLGLLSKCIGYGYLNYDIILLLHLTLSRPAVWLHLTRLGIPDKIVRQFRVLYDNSISCVQTGGAHSSWFKIEADVRQGCVLAPDSFATGTNWLLDRTVESCLIGVAFGQSCWILLTMSLSLLK